MDLKGAEIRNIKELCGEMNSKATMPMRVNIPFYQRPYKWNQDNISRLVDDFYKNNREEYFVGSVVMVASDGKRHDVIDGQQRITTLFLFDYISFIMRRSYIETLISKRKFTKIDTLFDSLQKQSFDLFGDSIGNKIKYAHEQIVNALDKADESGKNDAFYDGLLSDYQKYLYLPKRDFTNIDTYCLEFSKNLTSLLDESDLALKYSRDSYNKKLKLALANVFIKVTDTEAPSIHKVEKEGDKLVEQYVDAMVYEFDAILTNCKNTTGMDPLSYSNLIIDSISEIVENIKLCVIITGNEKDAYTLFEVLNDRALEIEDLDLIKNLFYKWYCNHSNDDDTKIDQCIERVDSIWVEKVFPPDTAKERAKLISFLATEFFTADESLKYNDSERYRDALEEKYLENITDYNSVNIENDISIYYMVSVILKTFEMVFSNRNEKVISAENDTSKSITYKCMHLLNALKQYGVMPAITNVIIKRYIDNHTDTSGRIKTDNIEEYVRNIMNDSNNNVPEYTAIHKYAYFFWKYALLAKDADFPRTEAKKVIKNVNINAGVYDYELASTDNNMLNNKFTDWMNDWRYGKSDAELKVKVIFIKLLTTVRNGNKLVYQPASVHMNTNKVQLDHLEANQTTSAFKGLYFDPEKEGELREAYVNSVGNFMILDSDNNNRKNNVPLQEALKFYDNFCSNHWLIKEIKDMLLSDSYSLKKTIDNEEFHIPKESFFNERRKRLTMYFKAILNGKLDDKEVSLD